MKEPKGMDARDIEYVLGVEDCATMVYNCFEAGIDQEHIKKSLEDILCRINDIRSQRFVEENGVQLI